MPMLMQVATLKTPSYAMIDDEEFFIDEEFLDIYGDWEVVDSWEGYNGMIFVIEPQTNE